MAEKLRSWRVLSCTLAVLATIVFIVACGDGKVVDVYGGEIFGEINDANDIFDGTRMSSIRAASHISSSSEEEPSSSSAPDDNGDDSSSSEDNTSTSSSSSVSQSSSSSSSEAQKSSSSSPYTLACNVINSPRQIVSKSYEADELATIIKIDCKEKGTSKDINGRDDVEWFNGPTWGGTRVGTYNDIRIKIYNRSDIEGCQGLEAPCIGTLIVGGGTTASSSSRASSASTTSSASGGTSSASGGTSSASGGTSSASGGTSSASGGTSSASGGGSGPECLENGRQTYCKWGSNCYPIDERYSSIGENGSVCAEGTCKCAALIAACKADSEPKKVFFTDTCNDSGGGTSSNSGGGSSSASGGGGSCTAIGNDSAVNISTNSCVSAPDACSGKAVKVGYWNGSNSMELSVSGACSKNFTLTKGNYSDLGCNGKVNITITSGNATDFKIGCW